MRKPKQNTSVFLHTLKIVSFFSFSKINRQFVTVDKFDKIFNLKKKTCLSGKNNTRYDHYFQTGAVHVDYYKDSDLTIGAVVNVWGRKIVLCDCDDFTKEYYRTKYGISE